MTRSGGGDETSASPASQRLDKWLWFARVVKTRTLAAGLVADGKVRLNATRIDKPGAQVKAGDVLTVAVHHRVRVLRVLQPGVRRGPPAEAGLLFEDLSPPAAPCPVAARGGPGRDPGAGRPTKRDRRALDRLKGDG